VLTPLVQSRVSPSNCEHFPYLTTKIKHFAVNYSLRVGILYQTNSITEALFEDALAQARDLDHTFRKTGKLQGPLHGIPITLKDQFNIRGVDTTLGYVGRSFKPATDDAVLVQMLKGMGAVIIAKTNLPQSIMVCISLLIQLFAHISDNWKFGAYAQE
jgi:6-phosphofructokinase